jgi:hypothetical protein
MALNRPADIGWVDPAKPIRGLDHLGVQAPCIALYAQLLPGITNVTDRARYYSFYPWLIRSFEQRYRDHSIDEFRRVLRRAECLFALIAIRHARVSADGDEGRHGAGMVGRLSLLRIPEDANTINLDEHAAFEGEKRYFLNKLGGLGQYYFGPLRDLRVLDYASEGEGAVPGYDKIRGSALADALAALVPQDEFFRLLEKTKIRWTDLDGISQFCPCALRTHTTERSLLIDLFFAKTDAYRFPESNNRRASLGLVLHLLSRHPRIDGYNLEDIFRAAAYTRSLPNGTDWDVAPSLAQGQRGWGTYQKNELFSLALQALFAAVLRTIEHRYSGRLESVAGAGEVCASLLPSAARFRERRLTDAVSELKTTLPALGGWQDETHEMQRGWRILNTQTDDADLTKLVDEAVHLLLSLLARGVDGNPYGDFDFDPDHFDAREIHLLSFEHAWSTVWADLTVEQWVRWLAVHWGIQRHLTVALRKLRGEHRDTFRIRPLDQELRVIEVPSPAATVPRLGRAFQILRDLNLTDVDNDGWPQLTGSGRKELEDCLAS